MPTYSYNCENCNISFELFYFIKDYNSQPHCPNCNTNKTHRLYREDVLTQSCSVKKSDSELKTLGDLAMRNTERMSQDEKEHLYAKHNSYKDKEDLKPLPTGMSRMKKPPKPKWPGTKNMSKKLKRKLK